MIKSPPTKNIELSDNQLLKKMQEVLSVAIEVFDVDIATAMILLRKILEVTVHNFYEVNGIEKPLNEEGYSTLSSLIKYLHTNKLVSQKVTNAMVFVKKMGNDSVHNHATNFTKDVGNKTIKNLCIVLVWYLEKREMTDNSLYLLVVRRAKTIKMKLPNNMYVKELDIQLKEIQKLSLIANTNKMWDWVDEIVMYKVIDNDLKKYLKYLKTVMQKYYNFYDKFEAQDYKDNYFIQSYNWLMGKSKRNKPTPGRMFREFYGSDLDYLDELKNKVKKKYLY